MRSPCWIRATRSGPGWWLIKAAKSLNLSRNIVSWQVLVAVSRFSPCLINLTRNQNICCGLKKCGALIGSFVGHEQICWATSCEFDEKRATKPKFVAQSRPALYFSQQLSSTRNKCFCCATSWSRKVKNGKHRQKLATKQCCHIKWSFPKALERHSFFTLKRLSNKQQLFFTS